VNRDEQDALIVANFMDVHAPLTASDEALTEFAPNTSRSEMPIGVKGDKIHDRIQSEDDYEGEDMYKLYKAAIWDLDRKIAPLVQDLINDDTLVIITADHGNWFRREHGLDEERLHVPLLIFGPDISPRQVPYTVNIRSLPRTTMEITTGESGGFAGNNLLEVNEHQLSITEFIHEPDAGGRPVTPTGLENVDSDIVYGVAAVKNGARVDHNGEGIIVRRGEPPLTNELSDIIEELREQHIKTGTDSIEYDEQTEDRLRDLGYL
jgi:2,3-bisphosphoglycerate-independent phosphoglycerate mutase